MWAPAGHLLTRGSETYSSPYPGAHHLDTEINQVPNSVLCNFTARPYPATQSGREDSRVPEAGKAAVTHLDVQRMSQKREFS